MKLGFRDIAAVAVACLFGAPESLAQNAYIPNQSDATVSVINTATNAVIATVPVVGANPAGVAVTPDGKKVYVTSDNTVSVINTATNTVIATVPVPGSGLCR
jgi:YVTN family beta-propeller protein